MIKPKPCPFCGSTEIDMTLEADIASIKNTKKSPQENKMKYTLSTEDTIQHQGVTLRRIIYADGTSGGWLEGEHNLSQDGTCRVLDEAKVCGNAWIFDNAFIYGDAKIYGNARVSDYTWIFGDTRVYGNAELSSKLSVGGDARISGH